MTTPQAALVEALTEARDIIATDRQSFVDCQQLHDSRTDDAIAHGLVWVSEGVWIAPEDAEPLREYDTAIAKIDAALAQAEAAQPVEPVLYVSPGQLPKVLDVDPEGAFGTYLPVRKTAAGKFTMPLYAAPQPAEAAPKQEAVLPSEDKARQAFWGCYPDSGNGGMSDVWMTAFRWCRAVLAAPQTPATTGDEGPNAELSGPGRR